MENKALYYKLNTIFWFVLSSVPLLSLLVYWLMYLMNYNETGSIISYNEMFTETYLYSNVFQGLNNIVPDTIKQPFSSLFMNVFNMHGDSIQILTVICGWFVFMHIIHLITDILLFFVNIARTILHRLGSFKF